jgi:hypothetical protein
MHRLRIPPLAVCLAMVAVAFGPGGFPVARAGGIIPTAGGEVVIIDSVTVGTHFVQNACGHRMALPVTVVATFIPPLGGESAGPDAVDGWTGGTGTDDNHFGRPQAHAKTQVFHLRLGVLRIRPSAKYGIVVAGATMGLPTLSSLSNVSYLTAETRYRRPTGITG